MILKTKINAKKLTTFCDNHSKANIFQTPEMYEVFKSTKNYEPVYLAVEDENEEIVGSLLAVIQKEHSGIIGKLSSRAIIWGGPLIKDDDLEILDLMLKEFNKITKRKAIYTQFRNMWQNTEKEKQIFIKHGFNYEDHLDIIHDLSSKDNIWNSMKSNARNKIRHSFKANLNFMEIHDETMIEKLYEILKSVYNNAKLPLVDIDLFLNAYKIMNKKKMIKFFLAVKDTEVIGTRIVFTYKKTIYDWYAGSDYKYYKYNPNDFLPWKVMEWGHNNGFKTFDFGGAGKPNIPYGVRDYKLKFGGELVNWGRFEKVHQPLLMKVGKIGFELYKRIK